MDRNKVRNTRRQRRKHHIRKRVVGTAEKPRITITRSLKNLSCQVIDDQRGVTLMAASTRSKDLRDQIGNNGGNLKGAEAVGKFIAQKAKELGITRLCFDRNGYRYHGRIAAVAKSLRDEGIKV